MRMQTIMTKASKILSKRDTQISIPFTMSDLRQQAGLLLAYMQVQQFQNGADAVHIILGRSSFLFAGMVSTLRTNIQLRKTSFCCANERLTRRQRSMNAMKAL